MTRDQLVEQAYQAISMGSQSFRLASRLFDRPTRERSWLLYCWCRHCDDTCDGQTLGMAPGEQGCVGEVEAKTRRAIAGDGGGELPFDALALLLKERPIPHKYIFDHLEGFRLDAAGWQPRSEADLIRYCYHVAGAVGVMMAIVMGVSPDDKPTLERAADLGIAFQLSNIARDIRDDAENGRCYLPSEWLAEFEIGRDGLLDPHNRGALSAMMQRLVALVGKYEASAREGVPKLPFRARWAVLSAAGIYNQIGRTVAALGEHAWDQRVVVPRRRKVRLVAAALREAIAA